MATVSGTINPSSAYKLTMTITESEVNVSKNTSKVKVVGKISGVKSSYYAYNSSSTNTVKIDGTTYKPTTAYNVRNGTSTQIFSYTKTVTHANDGSKKLSVSWSFNGNLSSYNPNGTVSGSVNLTKIARHGNISSTSGSINDESAPWIEFTNPANGLTKCWLELPDLTDDTQYAYRYADVTSRYTWELTEEERTAIRAAMANVESTKLTYCYANYVGDSWVERRSEGKATMTIVNGNPIFSDFSYRDTSEETLAVTGNDQILIAGKSILEVSISTEQKAVAQKQATMSRYVASISGQNAQGAYLDDETVVISGISGISEQTLSVAAIDSRGSQTPVSKEVTVLPYIEPTIVFQAERLNGFEADTTLSISGTISLLNDGENDLNSVQSVRVRVREQGVSEWGDWRELSGWTVDEKGAVSLDDLTLNLDNAKNYELEAEITDRLSSNSESVVVVAGIGVFRIGLDGNLYNSERKLLTEDDQLSSSNIQAGAITAEKMAPLSVAANNIDFDTFPSSPEAVRNTGGWKCVGTVVNSAQTNTIELAVPANSQIYKIIWNSQLASRGYTSIYAIDENGTIMPTKRAGYGLQMSAAFSEHNVNASALQALEMTAGVSACGQLVSSKNTDTGFWRVFVGHVAGGSESIKMTAGQIQQDGDNIHKIRMFTNATFQVGCRLTVWAWDPAN